MAIDSSPKSPIEFNWLTIIKAQLKDYISGNSSHKREINPGEYMFSAYKFGTKFIEIGPPRNANTLEPSTKIELKECPSSGVKFQYSLGTDNTPVLINNGTEDICVHSGVADKNYPDGIKDIKPGEWTNLQNHGGASWNVSWQTNNQEIEIKFTNLTDTITRETITKIKYLPPKPIRNS